MSEQPDERPKHIRPYVMGATESGEFPSEPYAECPYCRTQCLDGRVCSCGYRWLVVMWAVGVLEPKKAKKGKKAMNDRPEEITVDVDGVGVTFRRIDPDTYFSDEGVEVARTLATGWRWTVVAMPPAYDPALAEAVCRSINAAAKLIIMLGEAQ